MSTNPTKRIEEIDRRLEELPKGTLTYKKINGKEQPYIQRTIDGKSVSYYVKVSEREKVLVEFEERTKLQEEKKHLTAYVEGLKDILKHNPYLSAQVVIGYQDFEDFTCGQQFYVDKTHFITEWIREGTKITLITRPRRFGKTTLLSTVRMFFDPRYADHPEYFCKLRVWQDERSRSMFGSTPVISTSFGGCKGIDYKQSIRGMMGQLRTMYGHHEYLLDSPRLSDRDKELFKETKCLRCWIYCPRVVRLMNLELQRLEMDSLTCFFQVHQPSRQGQSTSLSYLMHYEILNGVGRQIRISFLEHSTR